MFKTKQTMKLLEEEIMKGMIICNSKNNSNGIMPEVKPLLAVERSMTVPMVAVAVAMSMPMAMSIQLSRRSKEKGEKLQDKRSRNTKNKKKMTRASSNRMSRRSK